MNGNTRAAIPENKIMLALKDCGALAVTYGVDADAVPVLPPIGIELDMAEPPVGRPPIPSPPPVGSPIGMDVTVIPFPLTMTLPVIVGPGQVMTWVCGLQTLQVTVVVTKLGGMTGVV
jgi:hypothetical protein